MFKVRLRERDIFGEVILPDFKRKKWLETFEDGFWSILKECKEIFYFGFLLKVMK